jgi:hypothetical protein
MAAGVRGVNPLLQPYRFVFFSPDAGSVAMFGYGLRMWAVFCFVVLFMAHVVVWEGLESKNQMLTASG